jgi:tetratricopeptide (TPR) repeat protein
LPLSAAGTALQAHGVSPCPLSPPDQRMSWWNRLTGGSSKRDSKLQRIDYLSEALALERQGDFDAALTSYRLALRDHPNDPKILQNMAIAFSKTGRLEEAIRSYRRALELDPELAGSHYGLAFLLLRRGDATGATRHLEAFLAQPPRGSDTARWVKHARETLDSIQASADSSPGETE